MLWYAIFHIEIQFWTFISIFNGATEICFAVYVVSSQIEAIFTSLFRGRISQDGIFDRYSVFQRISAQVCPVKFPSCFLSKSDAAIIIARNPLTGHFRDLAD